MVKVENLSFSYGEDEVLRDISFEAKSGELLCILGSNGVGKSTLFRCMLGLLPGYRGEVTVDGTSTKHLSARELARLVAYIPQTTSPAFHYSVEDIVLMGTASSLHPMAVPGKRERELAHSAMEKLGIGHLSHRCFHHLSGGERQLVVIARALTQQSKVLMLDEPTASLDFGNQMKVLTVIRDLAREGYTVIQTTHNPEHTYLFADRVLAMQGGSVLAYGTPREVITPETMGRMYGIDVNVTSLYDDRARVCLPGSMFGPERQ